MPSLLAEFLRAPRTVGSVLPSSPALAAAMLADIDRGRGGIALELGPGTGAFTAPLADRLGPTSQYLGVEINPAFVRLLKERFPQFDFVEASVEALEDLFAARGWSGADVVVSSLPWASLPLSVQDRAFAALARLCRPGATFATFGYVQGLMSPGAVALRRRLAETFTEVRRSPVIWRNFPPAIVYRCRR